MGITEDDAPLQMAALAKMATMQEHLTQEEDAAFDHVGSVLSVFEYHGRQLDRHEMPARDSAAFLADLHATCAREHSVRAVARGVVATEPIIMGDEQEDAELCADAVNPAPCRWVHMHGINYTAMDALGTLFRLHADVVAGCKTVSPKPGVSWWQSEDDHRYDHLFILAHYLQMSEDVPTSDDAVQTFDYEQV